MHLLPRTTQHCDGFHSQPCGRTAVHTYRGDDDQPTTYACPDHARQWDCYLAAKTTLGDAVALDLALSLSTHATR